MRCTSNVRRTCTMNPRPEVIFFDVGDTLIYIPVERPERIVQTLAQFGITIDLQKARAAASQTDEDLRPPGSRPPASIAEEDVYRRAYARCLLENLGITTIDPELLADGIHYVDYAVCYPETHDVLRALHAKSRLGIISNAPPRLNDALDRLGLTGYFEVIVNSSLVGVSKPEPAIYEIALAEMQIPAEVCAFVDDLPPNIATAERLGLTGLLVDRQWHYHDAPHRRVADLWPVVDLLAL